MSPQSAALLEAMIRQQCKALRLPTIGSQFPKLAADAGRFCAIAGIGVYEKLAGARGACVWFGGRACCASRRAKAFLGTCRRLS